MREQARFDVENKNVKGDLLTSKKGTRRQAVSDPYLLEHEA